MQPIISVVVPIYNVEDYLERCINSILNQTFSNFELILVNDGATDNSALICDRYESLDERIKVIHKKNGGLSDARNAGLKVAIGEYICFIDSDDYVHKKYLEVLYNICLEYKCDIAVCDYLETTKNDIGDIEFRNDILTLNAIQMLEFAYEENLVMGMVAWNKLYKRTIIGENYYPVGLIHEDEATTYKYILNSKKIGITSAQLYYYFQRENSIMGKKVSEKNLDFFVALEERMQCYKKRGLEKFYQEDIMLYLYKALMLYNQVEKEIGKNFRKLLKKKYRIMYKIADKKSWTRKKRIIYRLCFYFPRLYRVKNLNK